MNVAAGFDTGFSFFYTAINSVGSIDVYDGLDATGNILASLFLPVTPQEAGDPTGEFNVFEAIGVAFEGTAKSIDFGGTVNQIGFDNITFGSVTPGTGGGIDGGTNGGGVNVVPLPAAGWMLTAGLGGMVALRRRKKRV